jgi:sugar phosphate isomerase/epimerase
MQFYQVFGIEKTIDIFADAGFQSVDFNTDLPEYHSDEHDEQFYKELRAYGESRGIEFLQAHAPFSSSFIDAEQSEQRFQEIVKSIRIASWLGTKIIVVHPCNHLQYLIEENQKEIYEYNLAFYRRLIPYAKEAGVKIAIENIPKTLTATAEGLIKLYDELNDPVFVVCFDVGHAHRIGENPAEMIRKLGNRIQCTHIHDNMGDSDSHFLPYQGTIDWENVVKAFAEIQYTGDFSYEAGTFVKNVPIEMRAESAKYMAEIGRHLIARFESYKDEMPKGEK